MRIALLILIVISILLSSCHEVVNSTEEYRAFLFNPENGFYKTKSVENISLSAVYLPSEYLQYRNGDRIQADPGLKNKTATFLIIFESLDGTDLTFYGLSSANEYNGRQYSLNFELGRFATLKQKNSKQLAPKLFHWENTYGLSSKKVLQLVFADSELNFDQDIVLQFADPVFRTGITKFLFHGESINSLPVIK